MDSEAVEGLPYQSVLAKSRLPLEPAAPVRSGGLTDRQGKAVHQGESGVVLHQVQESLPDQFLDLPEVSRLPGEGGAVPPRQGWEEVSVMATEILVKGLGLSQAQILTHHLHGEDFGIGEGRHWPPLAQTLSIECGLQSVINPAKAVIINQSRSTTHLPEKSLSHIKRCW
jgi:hypothetical protein